MSIRLLVGLVLVSTALSCSLEEERLLEREHKLLDNWKREMRKGDELLDEWASSPTDANLALLQKQKAITKKSGEAWADAATTETSPEFIFPKYFGEDLSDAAAAARARAEGKAPPFIWPQPQLAKPTPKTR